MTIKELEKRVQELEAEVAALRLRPENHFHYHYPPQPALPQVQPWWPYQPTWTTCGASSGGSLYRVDGTA